MPFDPVNYPKQVEKRKERNKNLKERRRIAARKNITPMDTLDLPDKPASIEREQDGNIDFLQDLLAEDLLDPEVKSELNLVIEDYEQKHGELERVSEYRLQASADRTALGAPMPCKYNWNELRRFYILGIREKTEEGHYISRTYTKQEFADKFNIPITVLKERMRLDKWAELREAYLLKIDEINVGQELNIYARENNEAEIAAMNAAGKLAHLLDVWIEHNFGEVLDIKQSIFKNKFAKVIYDVEQQEYRELDPRDSIDLDKLHKGIKIAREIYDLQEKITKKYEHLAPHTDELAKKQGKLSESQRKTKLEAIKAQLETLIKEKAMNN